eukprot:11916573-Heterocapsa_arctica.AAC.1
MGSLNLLAKQVGDTPTNNGHEMASLLKDHWGSTFSKKEVDFKDLDSWWKGDGYSFTKSKDPSPPPASPGHPTRDPAWTLSVQHVERAI